MPGSIRVLIVEDHRVLAQGLELTLARSGDITVVGIAGTVADAERIAATTPIDVVLMDFTLPDGTGAEATAKIRARSPQVAVVLLTGGVSEDELLAAVEAGICGYLIKTATAAEVNEAVQRAAAGEMLLPPAILADLLRRRRAATAEKATSERVAAQLSPREHDILKLMAEGLENKSIAHQLSLSLNTVRTYVQQILEKVGAHSKLEAVVRAQGAGLLPK